MAIFRITEAGLQTIAPTTFGAAGVKERQDLQRMLRSNVDAIDPDLMVIAEEFSEWEDSKRRIDLLAIDRDANLVVIELKRTETGEHMDLQALRYAAMVSAMGWVQAVAAHRNYLAQLREPEDEAERRILEFLGWDTPQEDNFAQRVRVHLVSADFSRELTTTVLWLRDQGIDIRCVRMKPYSLDGKVLVDVQQVIPLPEAENYQVRLLMKERQQREARDLTTANRHQFWAELLNEARKGSDLHASISATDGTWISAQYRGHAFTFVLRRNDAQVEVYIDGPTRDQNVARFERLHTLREEIEREFGGPLDWQRLDGGRSCRIRYVVSDAGGYRLPPQEWPQLQTRLAEAMHRLERAIKPRIG